MGYNPGIVLQQVTDRIVGFLPSLIVALIIFLITLYVGGLGAKAVKSALYRRRTDPELTLLLARLAQWTIIIFGTIWALGQVNFDITSFVAGLGIVGFTVGFALKNVAENFIAGVLLLVQQPFDIGDMIEVSGFKGTVANIEIRATTIRTGDGLLVIIPNAIVYTNALINYSKTDKRRVSLKLGVAYESDLEKVNDLMLKVVTKLPGVIKDNPAPTVDFEQLASGAINATLYFWFHPRQATYARTLDAAIKGIKLAFEREGIKVA